MQRHKAWDYIMLGEILAGFARPRFSTVAAYKPKQAALVGLCERLGMINTKNTLGGLGSTLKEMAEKMGDVATTNIPTPDQYENIDNLRNAVGETLFGEATAQLLVPIDRSAVSQKLIDFPIRWGKLTDTQQHFHEETVLCLETGAYRAAMVMGWNLVYDCIRQWVFDDKDRLDKFNSELQKRNPPREVNDYEDFFTLGEWNVLEVCSKAGLFGGKIYERLAHYLRERNDYAHANFVHASADYAKAYINHLLDIVLMPPFKAGV